MNKDDSSAVARIHHPEKWAKLIWMQLPDKAGVTQELYEWVMQAFPWEGAALAEVDDSCVLEEKVYGLPSHREHLGSFELPRDKRSLAVRYAIEDVALYFGMAVEEMPYRCIFDVYRPIGYRDHDGNYVTVDRRKAPFFKEVGDDADDRDWFIGSAIGLLFFLALAIWS